MIPVLRKYLAGMILLAGILVSLFPGQDIKELENRLVSATGKERIGILVNLIRLDQDSKHILAYGDEALKLLKRHPDPNLQVDILNILCSAEQYLGEYDDARQYVRQALWQAQRCDYKKGYADALYYLGRNYYYQCIYDQSTDLLTKARQRYLELDDRLGIARTLNTFGLIHWRLGNYPRAMEYLLESRKVFEDLPQQEEQIVMGLAFSYNNTGLIYLSMKDYKQAMQQFLKAKKLHESLENQWGISLILNNIAEIYREQKEYIKALNYYKQSLNLKRELGYKQGIANSLHNIGKVYEEMQEYNYALEYLYESLQIRQDLKEQIGIGTTLIAIGAVKRKMGKYAEALRSVEQAMAIAAKINIRTNSRDGYRELSAIHSDLGNYPLALKFYKRYKEIDDTIFNETSTRRIAELQTQYEMEKNEKEISLLKKNKDIQNLALAREKNINRLIIWASVLVFFVVFVMYIRYRLKVKMNHALNQEIILHKQTEKKLQQSEETFKCFAESSPVGIYILQDDVICYVNPVLPVLFGCTREDILGQSPLKLILKEDQPMVLEKIKRRLSGLDKTVRYEFRGITAAGETLYLESYGGTTHYQGRPAVLETVIDISHRKRAAEIMLRSQKLEAMGILAGGIAHDFNNLLVTMTGYLATAKDFFPRGTPAAEKMEKVHDAHRQAAELAQELISFSKDGWIFPREVSLISILKDIIDTEPELDALINGICIPTGLNPIYGDERQLKQVFINLLRNAGEAKPAKKNQKVHVKLSAKNIRLHQENPFSLAPGDYIRVSLEDNGRGIPPHQLPEIFEPFFSTQAVHRKKAKGLGLALCQSIIKKHQGHISIASQAGKGTTVDIVLPVMKMPENN